MVTFAQGRRSAGFFRERSGALPSLPVIDLGRRIAFLFKGFGHAGAAGAYIRMNDRHNWQCLSLELTRDGIRSLSFLQELETLMLEVGYASRRLIALLSIYECR